MLPVPHFKTSQRPSLALTAFAPFPRSTWIHPHVPTDNFDRVCKNIWCRAREAEEELGTRPSLPERQQSEECEAPDSGTRHRPEQQQKAADDLGRSKQCMEDKQQYHSDFTLPCPYLSGRRHPHVAKPARVLSPVMDAEMKRNEGEAKGKGNLRDVEDKQRSEENAFKKILATQLSSRRDEQTSEPKPLAANPICSTTADHAPNLYEKEDPPPPSKLPRDTYESEDDLSVRSSSGSRSDSSSSDDDDLVSLPVVRTRATDSSEDDSASDNNDSAEEENELPQSSGESSADSKQDSSTSSTEEDFPPLSTTKSGILPRPTVPPASGKMHGQWEIPLSFHPHDIPTATLASRVATHAQAPVQGKAKAPWANSKTNAPPAAPAQEKSYDLLADFPAIQPPKKPLALGALCAGNPKANDADRKTGLTHSPNDRQENGASHQRRMENVPCKGLSICARHQKYVLDIQSFGPTSQCNSPTIICEPPRANNQPPPRVAGTDGMSVNAKTWASAAKAGMKQAAAPQEKARPCTFQQILTINRVKDGYSASQNFTKKVYPYHHAAFPLVTPRFHGPQPHNSNQFVRPRHPDTRQQFAPRVHQAICPLRFRSHNLPLQQARGHPPGRSCR